MVYSFAIPILQYECVVRTLQGILFDLIAGVHWLTVDLTLQFYD